MEWLYASRAWDTIKAGDHDEDTKRQRLRQLLTEILLSENLVLLTGLGTSLCVKGSSGATAPTMKDLWLRAKDLTQDFDVLLKKIKYPVATDNENIELLLSHCHLFNTLTPDDEVASFVSKAEAMIASACRFVDDATSLSTHESFLRRVARRPTRQSRLRLFTTNYDLCFEMAASRSRFIVVDGFSHTQPQEFDGSYFSYDLVRREPNRETPEFIPNVFHLYKLHGSVDWEGQGASGVRRNSAASAPLLIYPRSSKFELSYRQPFLEIMGRFQTALRQPNAGLMVIGFGFNDAHIKEPILAAIRSNISLKVVVVSPGLKGSTSDAIRHIEGLIQAGDPRLALLSMKFEELVPELPDLVAALEEERHRDRFNVSGSVR